MADGRLRKMVNSRGIVVAPGAFDMISAKLIEHLGFPAVYMTGNGQAASALGVPDVGLITLDEMADRVYNTAKSVSVPIIVDADTRYGSLLNLRRTIQDFEHAGASAIQIEDQVDPKKCGHTLGREVIDAKAMCQKLQVAVDARRGDDLLIIARCDARTTLGLDEAIRRGRMYHEAGADVIFTESPESEEEYERIGEELAGVPLLANVTIFGRSPLLTVPRYQELGCKIAIYPCINWLAALHGMEQAMLALRDEGTPERQRDQMWTLSRYHHFIGFPDVWAFEEKYGLKDYSALEAKYGART